MAKKLCDADCGITKLNSQEIINDRSGWFQCITCSYTDVMVKKCIEMVEEKGLMKTGLLSTHFNLPMSYMSMDFLERSS